MKKSGRFSAEVLNFWRPNVTISVVDEFRSLRPQEHVYYASQLTRDFSTGVGRLVNSARGKGYLPLVSDQ